MDLQAEAHGHGPTLLDRLNVDGSRLTRWNAEATHDVFPIFNPCVRKLETQVNGGGATTCICEEEAALAARRLKLLQFQVAREVLCAAVSGFVHHLIVVEVYGFAAASKIGLEIGLRLTQDYQLFFASRNVYDAVVAFKHFQTLECGSQVSGESFCRVVLDIDETIPCLRRIDIECDLNVIIERLLFNLIARCDRSQSAAQGLHAEFSLFADELNVLGAVDINQYFFVVGMQPCRSVELGIDKHGVFSWFQNLFVNV